MKRISFFIAIIVITVFALRTVLFIPGIIGHNWDWGIPNFPEQFRIQTEASFFIWDNRTFGGFFSPFRIELPYWLFTLIFSSLGGEILSKVIPLLILIIAGLSMFFTVRKIFSLPYFWALMSAILYMLSPFSYSRLIGGHLPILLGYAFLPLIFYFSVSLFGSLAKSETVKTWQSKLFFLILILTLGILHPVVLLVSWIVIFLTAGVYFISRSGKRGDITKTLFLVLVFWALLNSYWLMPILSQLVKGSGELSVRPWQPITEELSFRLPYFSSASRPLSELFTFSYSFGLNTEFVYPVSDFVKPFFILLSVILFTASIFAFYLVIRSGKKYFPAIFVLTLIEFIGFTLVAGEKTIFGRLFFFAFIRLAPIIFSVVSNPLRLLPLVVLPLSILSFVSLAIIEDKWSRFGRMTLRGLMVFALLVFSYPWFFHNLTTPVIKYSEQPMSLKVTKINPEDKKVFDFLKGFNDDFRIVHLPPAFVSWPGETDLSYIWNTIYSPKPLFLEYSQPILAGEIINSLYSQDTSKDLSKLLGLGSVKTIIYPHYQSFAKTYQTFIQETVDYKPFVDRNWSDQKGITKLPSPFSTVDLYENENFVPHIFVPEQTSYVDSNDRNALLELTSLSDYKIRNSVFFSPDNQKEKISLVDKLDVIYAKPECVGCEPPTVNLNELFPTPRFLPSSPLYLLTIIKEKQLLNAVSKYPHLRANADLVLATKKLAEVKIMIEEGKDISASAPKAIDKYYSLLMDFEKQLDYLTKEDLTNNQLLIRTQIFLNNQQEDLITIIQKTRNGEILNSAKQALEDLNRILSKVNSEVWLTTNNQEIKYLFNIPEDGRYLLLVKQVKELKTPLNFEIDSEPFSEEGERFDNGWLKLKTFDLNQSIHKLKVNLPLPINLFSGFATSSAVKRGEGANSFSLMAQKETTIVSSPIENLDDRAQYKLSFRYRVLGHPIRFTVEQENDEVFRGTKNHKIDVLLHDSSQWKKFDQLFSPNFGSYKAELRFYLNANKDEADTYLIEDIKVERVSVPDLLFKKEAEKDPGQLPKITFFKVNPTKYKVKIEKATTPYFLVFSETFHKGWKAWITENTEEFTEGTEKIIASYFDGQIKEREHKNTFFDREIFTNAFKKPIPEENHLLVNAFANAWYIDQPGSYEVTLEFTPQRIYFLGLWISLIAFVLTLGFLGRFLIKQRKRFL